MIDTIKAEFLRDNTAEQLKEESEKLVYESGNPMEAYRIHGGPVAMLIKRKLAGTHFGVITNEEMNTLAHSIAEQYNLLDYYPKVALVREALALTHQLTKVIGKIHPDFHSVLNELPDLTDQFDEVHDVFIAPYDKMKEITTQLLGQL